VAGGLMAYVIGKILDNKYLLGSYIFFGGLMFIMFAIYSAIRKRLAAKSLSEDYEHSRAKFQK